MVTLKGLPLTYNRDMQEDKEPLLEAAAQVTGSFGMARAAVVSGQLNQAAPAAFTASWVVATDLAEALGRTGTSFHQAMISPAASGSKLFSAGGTLIGAPPNPKPVAQTRAEASTRLAQLNL